MEFAARRTAEHARASLAVIGVAGGVGRGGGTPDGLWQVPLVMVYGEGRTWTQYASTRITENSSAARDTAQPFNETCLAAYGARLPSTQIA